MIYAIRCVDISDGDIFKIVESDSYEDLTNNPDIILTIEIPYSISHWNFLELRLFYEWVFINKAYIPADMNVLIDEWIDKEREEQLTVFTEVMGMDANTLKDIDDHDRCLELLKIKPVRR